MEIDRKLLKSGLSISLAGFSYCLVSSIIVLFGLIGLSIDESTSINKTVWAVMLGVVVVLMIFSIVGIVFASLSFKKVNLLPTEFKKQTGFIITTLVLDGVTILVTIIGMTSGLDASSLIFVLVLITAFVLIILDLVNNKNLIEKQKLFEERQANEQNENLKVEKIAENKTEETPAVNSENVTSENTEKVSTEAETNLTDNNSNTENTNNN